MQQEKQKQVLANGSNDILAQSKVIFPNYLIFVEWIK